MLANNVVTYDFEGTTTINTIELDGEILFEAKSVCKALGFANPRTAVSNHVDAEDVRSEDTLTSGGKQKTNYVTESGMYALIFGSRKPEAKRFKKWVTSEVLPAIRKTGKYEIQNSKISRPAEFMRELMEMSMLMGYSQSLANVRCISGVIHKFPEMESARLLLEGNTASEQERLLTPSEIGKELDLTPQKVNLRLAELGYQYRNLKKEWVLSDAGKQYGVYVDLKRKYSEGTVRCIRWKKDEIIDLLK